MKFLFIALFILADLSIWTMPLHATDRDVIHTTVIKMKRHVETIKDKIEFGDIADIVTDDSLAAKTLAHIELGASPVAGSTISWSAEDISKKLRPFHEVLSKAAVTIPEQITISRRNKTIAETLQAKVLEVLKNTLPDKNTTDKIWDVMLGDLQVPAEAEALSEYGMFVVPITNRPRGAAQFEVQFSKEGKVVERKWFNGRVSYFAEVATVQRMIEAHAKILDADLSWAKKEMTFTGEIPATRAEIAQATARMTIQPGALLTKSLLEREMAMKFGEEVELMAGEDTFSIREKAVVQQNGYIGDLVKVRPSGSPKVLTALVIGHGVVRVQY